MTTRPRWLRRRSTFRCLNRMSEPKRAWQQPSATASASSSIRGPGNVVVNPEGLSEPPLPEILTRNARPLPTDQPPTNVTVVVDLDVEVPHQEASAWCWAAVVVGVHNYYLL